ncbi:transaldolase A [Candidatus Blochmanniella floridana]|uniref:Transaldolase n=1 Tax=Blochmanniella floridana TaxID=203907 RepID=TAL_BLOFL|nr:RecName: Full=Transaldolase [Candidatus Blochmannia floridanus]CAD83201.1 transaldolase A [Candidatus Blochmannia floridanus]
MNQLDNLKKFSKISADTGDVDLIRTYQIQHATTNPSLILKSPLFTTYLKLFNDAIDYAQKIGGNQNTKITNASDRLIVNIGSEILANISGYISTEIDAQLSFNTDLTIKKAHKLITMYQKKNIDTSRVLIKIAATWEGIQAAEELEKSGIKCNLTLVFSFAQARACAERNIYLISPFIGRIYDWYNQRNLIKTSYINDDPGIQSIKKIYHYYKTYGYNTIIMGASFRRLEQILALSGCDYLTISPHFLKQLYQNTNSVTRQLFPPKTIISHHIPVLDQSEFFQEHNKNQMAVEKLNEGIQQFSIDQQKLHKLLLNNLNVQLQK